MPRSSEEEDSWGSSGQNAAGVAVMWRLRGPSERTRQVGTDHRVLVSFSPRSGNLPEDAK